MLESNKKKQTVKLVIFLVFFTIVCISCTVVAIYIQIQTEPQEVTEQVNDQVNELNTNTTQEIDTKKPNVVVPDNLGIKSITEKYDENPIKFICNDPNFKELWYASNYYSDRSGEKEIKDFSFSITGLKNEEVQSKINNTIKNEIEYVKSNAKSKRIMIEIIGNFANILSLKISSIHIAPFNEGTVIQYLTLNLSTGESLQLSDLFTNTAPIKGILTSGIYNGIMGKSVGLVHEYYEKTGNHYIDEYNISVGIEENQQEIYETWEENYYKRNPKIEDVESETLRILKNIQNSKELNFCVSPKFITIFIDNTFVTINMIANKESIAIYNKFKANDNIYDGTVNNNKNLYVFSSISDNIRDKYYTVNNNLIIKRN